MAIKSGQIIHDAHGFVVDRIQTAGVSNLNIPEERIYELGNVQSVALVRDTPDLSFDMESFDTSCEVEALLTGADAGSIADGQEFDFADSLPLDIVSPFKVSGTADVSAGIAVPYLTLETVTYRFGVRQNATQSFTLRGDTMLYVKGTPRWEEFDLVDNTLSYNLTHTPALEYSEQGNTLFVLSACVKNPSTGKYRRLFFGSDYTNTNSAVTLLTDWFDEGFTKLHVVYATAAASNLYPQSVHPLDSVKPAAIRGKDIEVYVSDGAATPSLLLWNGVQSIEVSRRVALDNDEELGNPRLVGQDYETAEVTGNVTLKPVDQDDLLDKLYQITGLSSPEVVGALSAQPLPLEIRINHPDTGDTLKTLYVEDARFQIPALQGQVQQKVTVQLPFSSDGGNLKVYNGER